MTKLFYLSEILKFAVEKEKQSEELYLALAQKTEDADCKACLQN